MKTVEEAFRAARQWVETERGFGVTDLPVSAPTLKPFVSAVVFSGNKKEALTRLEAEYKDCRLCPLSETRTKLVFGAGNPEAELMFVGEAPGFEEDKQGLPFVGAAGQLLTKIIEAMKMRREDVYIANCLKCRPPGNRSPLPDEIVTCNPILRKQIEIIQPKIICALGKHAAHTVLATQDPITRIRGRFFERDGFKIIPTFHPAYLLRNPGDKKLVWEDMKKILAELGRPLA